MEASASSHDVRLLRSALGANAAFSGLTGLGLLVAPGPAAAWLGVPEQALLRLLGIGLLAFAGFLIFLTRQPVPDRRGVLAASGSDFAWVAGSVVLLAAFPGVIAPAGRWAVAGVAAVVAVLGGLQLLGLRHAGRS